MRRALAFLVLFAACGSPTHGRPDGGGDDPGDDAAVGDDADAPDAPDIDAPVDAALVDPALCPIGPADGCCPLLRYGGHDPDCRSLSCSHLVASDPILLEDHQPNQSWRGGTGLAWTGKELAIARVENLNGPTSGQDLIVERRAFDGAVVSGPQFTRRTQPYGYTGGHTSLAYDETSKSLVFVDSTSQAFRATKTSLDGTIEWERNAYTICNGIDGIASALVRNGTLMVAGEYYTCAGSTGQPALAQFAQDGTAQPVKMFADGAQPQYSWEAGMACGLDCDHMFVAWNAGAASIRGRMFDVSAQTSGTPFELVGGLSSYIDHQGVASDGTRFFQYTAIQSDGAGHTQRWFRLYEPGIGYLGAGVTLAGTRGLPPSVIWTGDGWMVAVASFAYTTSLAFPSSHSEYHVDLYHFAPDGTLREQWQNETMPGYHPELAWAGGRIALAWVRATGTANEERYLRYFDCP